MVATLMYGQRNGRQNQALCTRIKQTLEENLLNYILSPPPLSRPARWLWTPIPSVVNDRVAPSRPDNNRNVIARSSIIHLLNLPP